MCDELIPEPWGNWSVCILPNAPSPLLPYGWRGEKEVRECGEGKRYHAMACLDQKGRLLDPSQCAETGQSNRSYHPRVLFSFHSELENDLHPFKDTIPTVIDTAPLAEMTHVLTSVTLKLVF